MSDDTDALSITLSSASSGPAAAVGSAGLRLGAKTISKLYLGATELTKLYLGSRLLFNSVAPGPPSFTPVAQITLTSANGSPYGIWSDGTTMWVGDISADKAF
ncbi:MAG: hypothetical protein OXI63_21150, partial [Candidatus Poribacteria bacterium]|nr:hypothetical protein [Candidatus Poribacteria bacterium]